MTETTREEMLALAFVIEQSAAPYSRRGVMTMRLPVGQVDMIVTALRLAAKPDRERVVEATDCEMAFIEACDEAGCPYDNEALLQAIADLKSRALARENTLKTVATLFTESVHETYTREEVVSLVEDMIRVGCRASQLPSTTYCTPDGPANCEAWAVDKRCPDCPVSNNEASK